LSPESDMLVLLFGCFWIFVRKGLPLLGSAVHDRLSFVRHACSSTWTYRSEVLRTTT
jgi:hypothetical protein